MLNLNFSLATLFNSNEPSSQHPIRASPNHERSDAFRPFDIIGFDTVDFSNRNPQENTSCQSLSRSFPVSVQDSIFLEDDLFEIAGSLDNHPMVYYPRGGILGATTSLHRLVGRSWDRLATACAFMPAEKVHLCVSRVIFHPGHTKDHPRISFLRGQIFDPQWVHLRGYRLRWEDQEIVFPKVFDVDVDYKIGELFFGPEDPRIIIEDVPGAEPVIVFNMISSQSEWKRAMWIFRPFTQKTTLLTIVDTYRHSWEKNWAPFFLRNPSDSQEPSADIHFVQEFAPLKVLRCAISSGSCAVVFEQEEPGNEHKEYLNQDTSLRGGTQFVPIPRSISGLASPEPAADGDNIQAFLSFPRHHVKRVCGGRYSAYRPEIATLITNTTHFYLNYVSAPLDFGADTVLPAADYQDACGAGRIMIVNSIVQWAVETIDSSGSKVTKDVMTLALSVNDATSQTMRVAGLFDLVSNLSSFKGYFGNTSTRTNTTVSTPVTGHPRNGLEDEIGLAGRQGFRRASAAAWEARTCLESAAFEYTKRFGANAPGFRQWLIALAKNLGLSSA